MINGKLGKRERDELDRVMGASCKPPAFDFSETDDVIALALERLRRGAEVVQADTARAARALRDLAKVPLDE